MSILFQHEWTNPDGSMRALPHVSTKNTSFLRTCQLLRRLGVKNYAFPLCLYDPDLRNVDVHSLNDPTPENRNLRIKVQIESRRNVWYFLREVLRIYEQGGDPVPFRLDRGSMAMTWCFLNGIDYAGMQPRQAQPYDAKILTPTGWSTMGDMVVGKDITAPDGTTIKVKGVYPQGVKDVYRVTLSDGRSTECCDDHLWKIRISMIGHDPDRWIVTSLKQIFAWREKLAYIYIPVVDPAIGEEVSRLITNIEYVGKKEVQCIMVDHPDHLYITDDYMVSHNTGKATPFYSSIKTPSGHTTMGDLKLGELVSTPDGGNAPVVGIYPQGELDTYRIVLEDGRTTECALEHLWSITTPDNPNPFVITLNDIISSYPHALIPVYDESTNSKIYKAISSIEHIGKKESQCIEIGHQDCLYITDDNIITHNTVCALSLTAWILYISGQTFQIGLFTKDNKLREDNVKRVRDLSESLPSWWLAEDKFKDKKNATELYYKALNTQYSTFVANPSPTTADKQARGASSPMFHFDEMEFCDNIHISYPTILASTGTARQNAKKNGKPHSNIITTTAGDPSKPECRESAKILAGAMPFTELLYDLENSEKLHEVVEAASPQKMILGVFSHLQLGYDNEWLREKIVRNRGTRDTILRDYLNRRVSIQEQPIIPEAVLNTINSSQRDPSYIQMLASKFVLYWYLPKETVESQAFKNRPIVVGCDSSEMIGRDSTTLVGIDPSDFSVVFTFKCNEGNINVVGVMIAQLLLMYPKMLFVPENKSSGTSLIDIVIMMLRKENHNPFLRIFNWVVNNKNEKEFSSINIRDTTLLDPSVKKYFGIKTDKSKRDELYSSVLLESTAMAASRIRDQSLIRELNSLTVRNGRVDHATDGNDDVTIAFLMGSFVILNGKHLDVYGLSPGSVLRNVDKVVSDKSRILSEKQNQIRDKLEELETTLKHQRDPSLRRMISGDIDILKGMLDNAAILTPQNADELNRDPRKFTDTKAVEEARKVVKSDDVERSLKMLMGLS
jgi:hypothetical protein